MECELRAGFCATLVLCNSVSQAYSEIPCLPGDGGSKQAFAMARKTQFNPNPFAYHQEVELEITTLTNLGDGLGRVDNWVVMVPFALPGERVRARIWRNHKTYSEADLVTVLDPSPDRVEPRCPIFGECGGCQYQNLRYDKQLEWKRRQIRELLERLGGVEADVGPPVPAPREYGYRTKLTPHYRKPRGSDRVLIGFLRSDRRGLEDVPACPIATDAINARLRSERPRWQEELLARKRGGTLLLRECVEGVETDMSATVTQEVADLRFRHRAGEFFQNNPYILPRMIEHVLQEAEVAGIRHLVDAYCGVGVFALTGACRFEETVGVEVSEAAVALAEENRELNGIANCRFIAGSAESIFEQVAFRGGETAVVLDPPRRGCDLRFLEQLAGFAPARVVYVSCDPATQARDAKWLVGHGYRVERVQPFDLFPQTRHIENVMTFSRAM